MTLRMFLWWLKRAVDPVGAADAEEVARLRADVERLKAELRKCRPHPEADR